MKTRTQLGFMLLRSMIDKVNDLSVFIDFFQLTTDEFFGLEALEDKAFLTHLTNNFNIHLHSLDLSISSGDGVNKSSLANLKRITDSYKIKSISDHIGFNKVNKVKTGMPILPPILTNDCLEQTKKNVTEIISTLKLPFFVENNSHCIDWIHKEMSEVEFINKLIRETDCFLLLDLANLLADSKNFSFSAIEYIRNLPVDKIEMIHIAGGDWLDGFIQNQVRGGHNKAVENEVWNLLDFTLKVSSPKYIVLERSRNINLREITIDLTIAKKCIYGSN